MYISAQVKSCFNSFRLHLKLFSGVRVMSATADSRGWYKPEGTVPVKLRLYNSLTKSKVSHAVVCVVLLI